ncbi:hypothetical protein [Amycolatopsis sp. NPDC051716]|uniref:hypothetical protein n=1 Tax=Amycolatopsis sp. NPDC051716 TaxID=3155804 RepID=UPI0034120545
MANPPTVVPTWRPIRRSRAMSGSLATSLRASARRSRAANAAASAGSSPGRSAGARPRISRRSFTCWTQATTITTRPMITAAEVSRFPVVPTV